MNRIQKIASPLRVCFSVLFVIIFLFPILIWSFIEHPFIKKGIDLGLFMNNVIHMPEGSVQITHVLWTLGARVTMCTGQLVGVAPFLLALYTLKKLFGAYEKGYIFTCKNAKRYGYLGFICFFDALLMQPLTEVLTSFGTSLTQEPGHRYITVGFRNTNIEAVFFGIMLMIISWVMLEATKMHDDQKLTI
jgi:hypothetical protein